MIRRGVTLSIVALALLLGGIPLFVNAQACPDFDEDEATDFCPAIRDGTRCATYGTSPSCDDEDEEITPPDNATLNCGSCTYSCTGGFADCNSDLRTVTGGNGCETADQRGGACTTAAGRPGTWSNACGTTCTETARPSVTLAPFAVQADDQATPGLWINKTGTGRMLQLQGGGTDRVIFTNSGQIILGLSSVDWTTFTQTVGAGENLIYGGITAASAGNVLLFQRAGTPNLTLLQLDADGNLTTGGRVRAPEVCVGPGADAIACRTSWPTGGITTSGTATAPAIPRFTGGAGATPLTLTNSLISETGTAVTISGTLRVGAAGPVLTGSSTGLSVGGNITGTGCFGAVYQQPSATALNGDRGGYVSANTACPTDMHVCTTSEILETIKCGAFAGKDTNGGTPMWINNLAPSLPTPTNDCGGWQTAVATSVGVVYTYAATGGTGGTTSCDQPLRFACCQ